MGFGICLKVYGDYACFTRPEMKVERVSYDVMTPSAARGILEAIYWKPAINWVIDKIHVLNEIKFDNIRRNEVGNKISEASIKSAIKQNIPIYQAANEDRQQRASIILKNVSYIIEAHFELTKAVGQDDTKEKHYNIALRRMQKGQYYHHPYFGCREFPLNFELIEDNIPSTFYKNTSIDLGWMLWDIDFENNFMPLFFRAQMNNGVIGIPSKSEVKK